MGRIADGRRITPARLRIIGEAPLIGIVLNKGRGGRKPVSRSRRIVRHAADISYKLLHRRLLGHAARLPVFTCSLITDGAFGMIFPIFGIMNFFLSQVSVLFFSLPRD